MSRDGHFWAKVGVNGAERRMFVDSDANLKVAIAPGHGDIDVLGMTFLSELQSWRVEGRTLILVPKTREMN